MNIKPIRNDDDLRHALLRLGTIFQAEDGASEADEMEILAVQIEAYEQEHFSITLPDPIAFIEYIMENRGLTRKDLEPYIGPRGRVSDILNRVRPLTLEMIRRLSAGLNMPAEVLIQDYPLRHVAP